MNSRRFMSAPKGRRHPIASNECLIEEPLSLFRASPADVRPGQNRKSQPCGEMSAVTPVSRHRQHLAAVRLILIPLRPRQRPSLLKGLLAGERASTQPPAWNIIPVEEFRFPAVEQSEPRKSR